MVTSNTKKYRKDPGRPILDLLLTDSSDLIDTGIFDCSMKSECSKMLSQAWFLGAVTLVAIHQIMQKVLNWNFPILDAYLDPLLFMPILLHLILWERRFIFKKGRHYILPWIEILAFFILVSVLCEYLFPRWSTRFTLDYWDVLCYAIGAMIFGLFLNKSL